MPPASPSSPLPSAAPATSSGPTGAEGSDGVASPLPPPPPRPARSRASRRGTWALAAGAAAGCAYLVVADPNAATSWYPQCPFKQLTGLDCPGCGVTRALRALVTGHPGRALDHNALFVVAAVAAVVWLAVNAVRTRTGRPPLRVRHPAWWGALAGAAVVAFWLVRNLRWGPFGWLASDASGA